MPDPPDRKAHEHPHAKKGRGGLAGLESSLSGGEARGGGRATSAYVELAVTSNFTFLHGGSHPDEFVQQAAVFGYSAIAVTDHNSLAGIIRAHVAAKEAGMRLIVGCRLKFAEVDAYSLLVYPTCRAAYGRLCRLLTLGKRRAEKGACHLTFGDVAEFNEGMLAIFFPHGRPHESWGAALGPLKDCFDGDRLSLAVTRLFEPYDRERAVHIQQMSRGYDVPLVAINDVYTHVPERQPLQDVLTCIRHGCSIQDAGFRLFPNPQRHLKQPEEMARLFADLPGALDRTLEIAERTAGFSLDELRYEYPHETCPAGLSPMAYLQKLTWHGATYRYPAGVPEKVVKQIRHEFALIEELDYAPYFLTVHDIVQFARSRGILCQGRGAAANSAVCFCLGVTSVDPDRIDVLFERFVSRERNEPPDIDIDFEHERREEVIQYIYQKYGRERAGLTAVVITYRARSAVRDVGKALGFSLDAVDRIAKRLHHWSSNPFDPEDDDEQDALFAHGFDPGDPTVRQLIERTREIIGFPRHLSQHVGGFVMTEGRLDELVPVENAAMPDRTVIEWDKDDIDAMGILKVDVLGLGMLSCIRRGLELIGRHHGRSLNLATIPAEDSIVYDMLCQADSLGVFQVESRAQMTMLPRLRPRCYYDLVIEVAIVRPGPVVGDMVHPYLRRRNGEEDPNYPDEKIRRVLGKTLGVPLFQEQVMSLAVEAAGFTAGEAERLRRAITAWTSKDKVVRYTTQFIQGMLNNGYEREFAEWCFHRLKGFSQYGFPESHAASFALLVYASAWIKCYYPAVFAAALLNSQPMGFYAPAQIVRDAREHGVLVRPIDVNRSEWDCTLEDGVIHADSFASKTADSEARGDRGGSVAGRWPSVSKTADSEVGRYKKGVLRLGMRMIKGLRQSEAERIVGAVRLHGMFATVKELWQLSGVSKASLHTLAAADGFQSMNLDRQRAIWEVRKLPDQHLPLLDPLPDVPDARTTLPAIREERIIAADYQTTGLSLKNHPVAFFRDVLKDMGAVTAAEVKDEKRTPFGRYVAVAGLVLFRQRPGTAKGIMFMTIEDETARVDLIVRPDVYKKYRAAAIFSQFVLVRGKVERNGLVLHVIARAFQSLDQRVQSLPALSRDFR